MLNLLPMDSLKAFAISYRLVYYNCKVSLNGDEKLITRDRNKNTYSK